MGVQTGSSSSSIGRLGDEDLGYLQEGPTLGSERVENPVAFASRYDNAFEAQKGQESGDGAYGETAQRGIEIANGLLALAEQHEHDELGSVGYCLEPPGQAEAGRWPIGRIGRLFRRYFLGGVHRGRLPRTRICEASQIQAFKWLVNILIISTVRGRGGARPALARPLVAVVTAG
jgi:hypothetical protein